MCSDRQSDFDVTDRIACAVEPAERRDELGMSRKLCEWRTECVSESRRAGHAAGATATRYAYGPTARRPGGAASRAHRGRDARRAGARRGAPFLCYLKTLFVTVPFFLRAHDTSLMPDTGNVE